MRASRPDNRIAIVLMSAVLALAGCGGGGGGGDADSSLPPPVSLPPPTPPPPPPPSPDPDPDPDPDPQPPPPPVHKNLFTPVSEQDWDETAVRKVLHAFAFGGQTTDAQIAAWADMAPEFAIEEMLNFNEHNLALSTPAFGDTDGMANRPATLRALAAFWSSDDPANAVPEEYRYYYDIDNFNGLLPRLWLLAAKTRGLNPFRHKIGFWETNYHMAVNMRTSVAREPLLTYYDEILAALERDEPYQDVMKVAASSAAIALQYGHRSSRFRNGVCDCNEDFSREYHQLFFGVLGSADPVYHETVTIKNTAKVFTDMTVHSDDITGVSDIVDFGTFYHPDEPLEILGAMIGGTTAAERIAAMVDVSIIHPESLDNLPVMIVRDLADDNLDTRKITAIRAAWRSLEVKNLLTFLRGYAISTIFHDASRIKYLTSIDRHLLISNLLGLSNLENYLDLYYPRHADEGVEAFIPTHNVFGSQKGTEAAASDRVFRSNFSLATEWAWRQRASEGNRSGQNWEKDWATVAPRNGAGQFDVRTVAEWLWQRFIADGLKNFGPLEQAHVYALLATGRDLAYVLDETNADRVVTTDDVLLDPQVILLVEDLAGRTLLLDSSLDDDRRAANRGVGMAINFIIGTPYIFAQQGK